jgi:hypothetical protein
MAWIRSQHGNILIKTSMLYVNDYGDELSACIGSDREQSMVIGRFPTEERTLEELNKIQRWINERGSPDAVYQITRPPADNQKGEPAS